MGPIVVPVGSCSPPIQVPSGIITITEATQVGVAVENVTAYSYDQFGNYIDELDSWTPPQQIATVTVMPGDVSLETVATFTNYAAPPGTLKICKIAGSPDLLGKPFSFTATDGTTQHMDIVNAGPPTGGNCVIDGTWPVNDPVTVTETVPSGVAVSNITVEPPDRGGPPNLNGGYVTVTIGSGFTEVDFTDIDAVVIGSCSPSSSMSVLQVTGTNVLAFVPLCNWLQLPNGCPIKGVQVANVEGTYLKSPGYYSVPGITDDINSCASDPILGQTVCTANYKSNQVYVIGTTGGGLPKVNYKVSTAGSGLIAFTGGCSTNTGVAMDAKQHEAVIGVSINGSPNDSCTVSGGYTATGTPEFQFLNLNSGLMENPPIKSPAHQIAEDFLIDPTSTPPRLLSPAEGIYCYPPVLPPLPPICTPKYPHPNYEIADVTYPVGGGNTTLKFYENTLNQSGLGFPGGWPDSAAEDCSAEIALASEEFETNTLSTPYTADLPNATFTVGTGGNPGTWTFLSPYQAYQGFNPLSGSYLSASSQLAAGPIAVAQGGSHEGVLGQESSGSGTAANTITAFKLNFPYVAGSPFFDWVTCNLGNDPTGSSFWQGADPHTVTAYQSPNPPKHSFAVLANRAPATYLAVVDLDMMLNKITVPRDSTGYVCLSGTLPSAVVRFVQVRP